MIVIKTEKQINKDGIKGRIIKDVTGIIPIECLPKEYSDGMHFTRGSTADAPYGCCIKFCYGDKYDLNNEYVLERLRFGHDRYDKYNLYKNRFVTEDDFQEKLKVIKIACQILHEINKKIRQKEEEWKEVEEFKV